MGDYEQSISICTYNIAVIGLLFINVLAPNFEAERARR